MKRHMISLDIREMIIKFTGDRTHTHKDTYAYLHNF